MAIAVKSPARKRVLASFKTKAVAEGGLLEEIGALRGQVEQIGDRLFELESLHIVRAREAARTDWSPHRGISWEELRAKGRVIMAKHGL